MDIAEFVERFFDIELKDWQKVHLKALDSMRKNADIRIAMPKGAGLSQAKMYIYMNKELISNGAAHDSKR